MATQLSETYTKLRKVLSRSFSRIFRRDLIASLGPAGSAASAAKLKWSLGRRARTPKRRSLTRGEDSSDDTPTSMYFMHGIASISHPEKRDQNPDPTGVLCSEGGGDDSAFSLPNSLGIADGVGAWANVDGGDSARVSRLLMHYSSKFFQRNMSDHKSPVSALVEAWKCTQEHIIMGSTTVCLVALNDDIMQTANIGDSGYLVVRNGVVHARSKPDQLQFNW